MGEGSRSIVGPKPLTHPNGLQRQRSPLPQGERAQQSAPRHAARPRMTNYTPNEMMTIAAARALKNEDVCFVGIGMPSAAANLARLTHAPNITLIYESGTLATKPNILPLSIGDGELCETAITTVSVPEMFRYWLQGGRIKGGFLGGAQIDKFANLNRSEEHTSELQSRVDISYAV